MSGNRVAVALAVWAGVAVQAATLAAEETRPTAWTARVQPLDTVERIVMPAVDEAALRAEDDRRLAETGELSLRFAANLPVDVTPDTAGTWERLDGGALLWRLRVFSANARSLNFGFDRYSMPKGGRLFIYSPDGKHVHRPFTADDNEKHGQLWTPPVFGEETVLEVTVAEGPRGALELHLASVNHDYRGIGQPGMEKSGGCNIDVVCPVGAPYDDQDRAVSALSINGSLFCSGSLVNNTAGDRRPYLVTARHCGINSGNAATVVAYWNYFNSTCRAQGPGPHPRGDGSLSEFNTGSFFRVDNVSTDFTLVELDDPLPPASNLYLAGWDRTPAPAQFTGTAGIHHPLIREMRISFAPGTTVDANGGTHINAFWGPGLGTVEPGSSGSPLYTQDKRYVGQLQGGLGHCGPGALYGSYGRFSESWTNPGVAPALDPLATGQLTVDGLNGCAQPSPPAGVTATALSPNTIRVAWTPVPGAAGYDVFRAVGSCPQATVTRIATNLTAATYDDATVSGASTYAYVVRAADASGCRSEKSNCDDAVATGGCTLPPAFAGATPVSQPVPGACRLDVSWLPGLSSCGGTLKYNVYRSTDPLFVPGPSSLRQACVSGGTFADTSVAAGNAYYYVVRAEDGTTGGTGPCNGGNEDANVVRQAGDPDLIRVFSDDAESGPALWAVDDPGPGNPWAIVTNQSNSPQSAWFVDDPPTVTDQRLAFADPVLIPVGSPELSFWHEYDLEGANASWFDAGVLEYSLDGATWFDILSGNGGGIPDGPNRLSGHPYRPNGFVSGCCGNPLAGRRAWSGVTLGWVETRADLSDFSGHAIRLRWRRGTDSRVADPGWWVDDVRITRRQTCGLAQSVAAVALSVDAPRNGVLQPNESAAVVAPTWMNTGSSAIASLSGTLGNFAGPAGPVYTVDDRFAGYGALAAGGTAACTSDCYAVSVQAATRPSLHWDATARETVSINQTAKTWTLHLGDSFVDVPVLSSFYRFIETILHRGVTGGCTATTYCPGFTTTRDQMAVFVLVSKEGAGYAPAACVAGAEMFADVPASSPYCRWIEELARRNVVGGCGGGNYCPADPANREAMAVFVLRTLDPALSPPVCVAGSEMFADVPATSAFCRWIEELARRGVVAGCGGGNYCPTTAVTREQMSVFLAVTFGLTLYGV